MAQEAREELERLREDGRAFVRAAIPKGVHWFPARIRRFCHHRVGSPTATSSRQSVGAEDRAGI